MMPPIVGICRFSFVGRGDWVAFRDGAVDHTDAAFRQARAELLYAPERMERRFATLEHLLIKSIHAQTEDNFILFILTSDLMPEAYRMRLRLLTLAEPKIRVIYSSADDVDAAIVPELNKLTDAHGERLVQFRIDDDDCLTHTYVETLHDITNRFSGMGGFAFSFPKGVVTSFYEDQAPRHYKINQPFHSAGAAVRPGQRGMSLFNFGHFALMKRFNSYLFNDGYGHFSTKLVDQDSLRIDASEQGGRDHEKIGFDEFSQITERFFPFLEVKQVLDVLADLN